MRHTTVTGTVETALTVTPTWNSPNKRVEDGWRQANGWRWRIEHSSIPMLPTVPLAGDAALGEGTDLQETLVREEQEQPLLFMVVERQQRAFALPPQLSPTTVQITNTQNTRHQQQDKAKKSCC